MDHKALYQYVQRMTPKQRVLRFGELDAWFERNPAKETQVFAGSPTGIPSTPLDRQNLIAERMELAFTIARDAVRSTK